MTSDTAVSPALFDLLALSLAFSPCPEPGRFRLAAARVQDWEPLPALVEAHRMAPLFYHQLSLAGVEPPRPVLRTLKGQALRTRLENQARVRQVAALAEEFARAEIPLVFLKGCALAHLLYPDPGLRPMSDIDVLVHPENLAAAADLALSLGFHPVSPIDLGDLKKKRHLPILVKREDGYRLQLELHFTLMQDASLRPFFGMQDLRSPVQSFTPAPGIRALSLGHEDMLHHLCWHTVYNAQGCEKLSWGKIADILNYAETFKDQVNWDMVRRHYPDVLHVLAQFHDLVPLSPELLERAQLALPTRQLARLGEGFQGWPAVSVKTWRATGMKQFLGQTFFPSPWWLRLEYGDANCASVGCYWVKHVCNLFRAVLFRAQLSLKHKST